MTQASKNVSVNPTLCAIKHREFTVLKNILSITLFFLFISCSGKNRVEIRLHSPDGNFEFKELSFTVIEIYKTYNLATDWDKIVKDRAFYPETKIRIKKQWFFDYYLNLDNDADYLVGTSGGSGTFRYITNSGLYPIYRDRKNHINLFMKYDPILKIKYSKSGNSNDLIFSWSTFPEAKYYSLSVRPILRDNPNPEEALSCFIKNRDSVSLGDCYKHKSAAPIGFPKVAQDIFSFAKTQQLNPGTYEFTVTAHTFDEQLAQYVPMSIDPNEVSKTQLIVNPY